jgi:hypothetical protein
MTLRQRSGISSGLRLGRPALVDFLHDFHRTASEIAATVAGTRLPPSYCASFRAARIATMMPITRLRDSSTY